MLNEVYLFCRRYLESASDAADGGGAAGGAGDERRMKAAEKAAADASKQLELVRGRLKEAEERVKVLEKEAKAAAKAASSGGGGGEFSAKDKIMLEKKVRESDDLDNWAFLYMFCHPHSTVSSLSCTSDASHSLLQVADTEKKLTKEIEILKAKEKRAVDAADAATAQVNRSSFFK